MYIYVYICNVTEQLCDNSQVYVDQIDLCGM